MLSALVMNSLTKSVATFTTEGSSYTLEKVIGSGAYGAVAQAIDNVSASEFGSAPSSPRRSLERQQSRGHKEDSAGFRCADSHTAHIAGNKNTARDQA